MFGIALRFPVFDARLLFFFFLGFSGSCKGSVHGWEGGGGIRLTKHARCLRVWTWIATRQNWRPNHFGLCTLCLSIFSVYFLALQCPILDIFVCLVLGHLFFFSPLVRFYGFLAAIVRLYGWLFVQYSCALVLVAFCYSGIDRFVLYLRSR